MNQPIDDGGPAFPGLVYNGAMMFDAESNKLTPVPTRSDSGMSLRDRFALQVLNQCKMFEFDLGKVARRAYEIADALLEARMK